ncbi:MAG: hypothetical protein KC441_11305, partial [Anaerolineales bacterium]|nr:hypothetical protein [Anaerolineales bacterium]
MTTQKSNPIPRLDLAPKLDRPLRLWWPLDYLRLLYWVFFIPQALRWYVEKFGVEYEVAEEKRWQRLQSFWRTATPQRNLFLQGQLLLFIVLGLFYGLVRLLAAAGITIDMGGVAVGVAFGVA